MHNELSESQLQSLVERVFNLFDSEAKHWPDIVQVNRSGYSDSNIRGIWTFQERVEFLNVPFPPGTDPDTPSNATSPDSSGSAE